ncbi:Retrotrans gag domain-containing protein [Abeliophyllum distichum]|uniref:Retrotrans gag domain-containing protein n=1 Tax=Abeliophyllum distichum TaxID=126358 RepID=A0ABD1VZA2_9LAMI
MEGKMESKFSDEDDFQLDSRGRLKISLFYNGNPDWWLSRAEMIFKMNRLSEVEKVEAAAACFDGEAWAWFQWVDRRRTVRTWGELKDFMVARFRLDDVFVGEEFST